MMLNNTVIPSVRRYKNFEKALSCESEYILLSEADIGNLQSLVGKCHKRNKKVLIHLELLGGFKPDPCGLSVLKKIYKVDGVISSNFTALRYAKKEGLITIYRILLIDSRALDQSIDIVKNNSIDVVELLPAEYACLCFDLLKNNFKNLNVKFIAGGFVKRKYLVDRIFYTGFDGITTSEPSLW
ncbi:glycerol-3-phosphate responsive antiterminator [Brenneria izadpanahii]|uniref:Glycerol-3-phosphate responsive antiterminator n=1 Tax=Brenneria izadpanahii TaxID=2722756 RepID=A0ABX7UPQ3_9GAMM|nr:glycerol-3-phosphate responsive antiterminator [Brenneria izadpanahii]QTF06507.1 glycerol-3-phosphate responsive antiterminator [Brenneria izadpanahii]